MKFNVWICQLAIAILALTTATGLAGCKKTKADPFPASAAVAGWEKTGPTRTFKADDLWQYIDGEAEKYIRAGVVSASTSDYRYQGQIEATVDIYTMKAASGANDVFEKDCTKDATAMALGDAGMAYEQSVIFRKGPNLVRIVAYESTPATQQALLALAHGVDGNL